MLGNASLVVGSLLVTTVALELLLRWQGYDPLSDVRGRDLILRPSPVEERVYEATPNASGRVWGAHVEINSHGFRDREYALEKREGVERIVVLGDSVAFGNFLPAEARFSDRLERLLEGRGRDAEVLNLALGGYDTLQEVSTLEQAGLPFDPDVVLLSYCINDIGVASLNLEYIQRAQRYGASPIYASRLAQFVRVHADRVLARYGSKATDDERQFIESNRDRILDVSDDAALRGLVSALEVALEESEGAHPMTPLYASNAHLGRLRYALQRLGAIRQAHGFDVLAGIVPVLDVDARNRRAYEAVYDILRHEFGRVGFQVVDIPSEFARMGIERLRIHGSDQIHPNALGHAVMARLFFDALEAARPRSSSGL